MYGTAVFLGNFEGPDWMQLLYFSHASEEKRCLTRGQNGATKMEEIGRKSRLYRMFPAGRFFGRLTQKGLIWLCFHEDKLKIVRIFLKSAPFIYPPIKDWKTGIFTDFKSIPLFWSISTNILSKEDRIAAKERDNSRNPWWGPECKLSYLSHMPWINKQRPGAIQSALSPAQRAKDARRSGNRRQRSSQLALRFRGGRTVCKGLSARLADDLLPLGEPGDHH